jgi:hypothetical protein
MLATYKLGHTPQFDCGAFLPSHESSAPQSMSTSTPSLLSVRGVSVRFGGIVALDGVGFDVQRGQICGLIGPNGAGKTTLFNCLSRLYQYQEGDILFEGKSITNTPTHRIAGLGMGRPSRIWRCSAACRCGKTSRSARIADPRPASCPARCAYPATAPRKPGCASARRRSWTT